MKMFLAHVVEIFKDERALIAGSFNSRQLSTFRLRDHVLNVLNRVLLTLFAQRTDDGVDALLLVQHASARNTVVFISSLLRYTLKLK